MSYAGTTFRLEAAEHPERLQPFDRDAARETRSMAKALRIPERELPGQLPLYTQPAPVAPAPEPPDRRKAAHTAVTAAEAALLAEEGRPRGREHWARMATAYERRAAAWRLLAVACERDGQGHPSRAMSLAATADTAQARMLRSRLAVSG